ncbi:hypothetical protein [Loktanella sp. S4079]|uniref:hypothetical protein n=1 Tax=Loktanella sp. S4079 TaxID=579483 RepID=UPI0005FA7F02|nr:hypothetical protein [Loktanella sp. S4079]KJZ20200.1 hypothetical protein TW80_05035 [Loktanella sp. S4079]
MARRNLRRTRMIILSCFGFTICAGAFILLSILAPISTDPELVGQTLGRIGGAAGFAGLAAAVMALFVRNDPKT